MLGALKNNLRDMKDAQRISAALCRGAATSALRRIRLANPQTWEFCGFSQNGEDGVIDMLRSHLRSPNRYFLEIGASDGLENNTAWLAIAERMAGLMIEGHPQVALRGARVIQQRTVSVDFRQMFVTEESAREVLSLALFNDPDVLSVDIDGNDYYVVRALMRLGLKPKIIVVEYNSAFGPDRCVTIPYSPDFSVGRAHPSRLYYGVSVGGWRKYFDAEGYEFVGVEKNGVNAFFVRSDCFDPDFLSAIEPVPFAENTVQFRSHRLEHNGQFGLIANEPLTSL